MRSDRFDVAADRDFADVMRACASARKDLDQRRDPAPLSASCSTRGHAHSIEVYEDGELVGGLYGVSLGAAFFGESMFHRARDASKVALVHLVARLRLGGFRLLDTQFLTDASGEPRARSRSAARPIRRRLAPALDSDGGFRAPGRRAARCPAREALRLARQNDGTERCDPLTEVRCSRRVEEDRHGGGGAFDEMGPGGGRARARSIAKVARWLEQTPPDLLAARRAQAEYMFRRIGITFGVYGDKDAAERLIPFDIVPRLHLARRMDAARGRASPSASPRSTCSSRTSMARARS